MTKLLKYVALSVVLAGSLLPPIATAALDCSPAAVSSYSNPVNVARCNFQSAAATTRGLQDIVQQKTAALNALRPANGGTGTPAQIQAAQAEVAAAIKNHMNAMQRQWQAKLEVLRAIDTRLHLDVSSQINTVNGQINGNLFTNVSAATTLADVRAAKVVVLEFRSSIYKPLIDAVQTAAVNKRWENAAARITTFKIPETIAGLQALAPAYDEASPGHNFVTRLNEADQDLTDIRAMLAAKSGGVAAVNTAINALHNTLKEIKAEMEALQSGGGETVTPAQDTTDYGQSVSGVDKCPGTCQNRERTTCNTTTGYVTGLCPGPSYWQCCPLLTCSSQGGTCVDGSLCKGEVIKGVACAKDLVCCSGSGAGSGDSVEGTTLKECGDFDSDCMTELECNYKKGSVLSKISCPSKGQVCCYVKPEASKNAGDTATMCGGKVKPTTACPPSMKWTCINAEGDHWWCTCPEGYIPAENNTKCLESTELIAV